MSAVARGPRAVAARSISPAFGRGRSSNPPPPGACVAAGAAEHRRSDAQSIRSLAGPRLAFDRKLAYGASFRQHRFGPRAYGSCLHARRLARLDVATTLAAATSPRRNGDGVTEGRCWWLVLLIDHVVLVMLENRSFDHMLRFWYPKSDDFDGLDGTESNLDANGKAAKVFEITPGAQNAYYFPLANPSEGFVATNRQLFSSETPPASGQAANNGFVTSFANELQHPAHPLDPKLVGAAPASIMGMYTAEILPVLSNLAKGFAVSARWFAAVPTQTFPNRAFAVAGTSLGYVDNSARGHPAFDTPSVFGKLADAGQTWKIYGYSGVPLTAGDFPDTVQPGPNGEVVSGFTRFQDDAAKGQLAAFLISSRSGPRTGRAPATTTFR